MLHMANRQLEVITGCMFSGKTDELIRRLERVRISGRSILLFKPSIDDRYADAAIVTHYGREFAAHQLTPGEETLDQLVAVVGADALAAANVIAFDEGNFFTERLTDLCQDLVAAGKRVIVAGLDLTFAEEPFGPMGPLMSLADRVDKLQAVCVKCGGVATRSQRLIDGQPAPVDGPTIQVGGIGSYEARCRNCYVR
ncbi:thymidine kinase [Candidatus Bipolaricaulota bacterium]|nr:thymidine kinase [Candidatus Bipolaricaulota bacterium]TFH09081.1 MAG: thymidine kinase [Candidatus Atribacteria bacterium]